ncbi:MAG: DUF4114 domain-containing protein [Deltaproteobacteria bacterium]|nr:DUF4114 domain-containing protein [Deltaproteobacteria bacterium]
MKKRSILSMAALAWGLFFQQTEAQALTQVDLDPAFVAEVEGIFNVDHDGTAFNLDLVADEDPNLRLFQEAEIYVTFIHERAGYKNQFGYFTFDDADGDGLIAPEEILDQQLIFENVSEDDGTLTEGNTVKIGPFPAGTQVGFYVVANGYVHPKGTFYTLNELNSDNSPHMAMVATSDGGNVAIGIEDKPWASSDLDFNDVIFTFTTTPESALDEIIEDSNIPVNEVPADVPSDEEGPGAKKVCFCHNVNHNPHTICTADEALINAHMAHVNGENPGVQDALGECEEEEVHAPSEEPCDEEETPGEDTEQPGDETEIPTEEPGDETEQPSDETEEPSDEQETPEEPAEEDVEETPADESEAPSIPDATKVDGFDADGEIAVDEAGGPFAYPAWYFEGSGNMGCSLGGAGSGTTDLAPWALFAAVLMISPLRRIRKK